MSFEGVKYEGVKVGWGENGVDVVVEKLEGMKLGEEKVVDEKVKEKENGNEVVLVVVSMVV